jgi:DNA-directed RNA polymerase
VTAFLNAKQSRTREKAIDAARTSGAMDEMIQAINYLSSTPWRVSHTVLDDLERLWPDTEVSPALLPYMRTLRGLRIKPEDKVAVDLARNYRDVAFYNFVRPDYRGRIYPATTELSPVANDLARSLLVFDKKKQLGADGWRALKLHLAGLFGATKRASFDERLAWVDAHWDEIIDSGAKGLDVRPIRCDRFISSQS